MLKKLVFILGVVISMLPTAYAADDIIIEGENPANGNKYLIETLSSASSGKFLSIQYSVLNKEAFWVSYDVNVDCEGYYDLVCETTRPSYEHCSDFRVSVNNGKELLASREAIEYSPEHIQAGHMGKLDFGGVYLNKGINTIKFFVDERVKSTYNGVSVCFYLDTIELKPSEIYIRNIYPGKSNGIFEENDGVNFDIIMNAPSLEDVVIEYKITDHLDSVIKEGNFEVPNGKKKHTYNFDLGIGWYNILFSYENESISKNIAVIHNYDDRKNIAESPFALDLAMNWEVTSYYDKLNFARAARLLGVQWVRDRFDWSHMYNTDEGYAFYPWNDDSINILSNEGLKILEVFHSNPNEYSNSDSEKYRDLRVIYDSVRTAAEHYKGKVNAWEVWNEPDIGFGIESAEEYSAYFKAAAIGISDSESGSYKLNAGMAEYPVANGYNCSFSELCMRNDIMDYSDAYTYHIYSNSDETTTHQGVNSTFYYHSDAHNGYAFNLPMWVSEGGYGFFSTNSELNENEQLLQARSTINLATDSIAKGNDMHFWFILGQRQEGTGRHFGMLNSFNEPNIAYAAYSNMTYQLGKADYKGVMSASTDDVFGHLFSDGEKDVAVLWSKTEGTNYIIENAEYVNVIDMVGNEQVIKGVNGRCTITLSPNPIYVIFDGGCSIRNYYEQNHRKKQIENKTIENSEKIVLRQVLGDESVISSKASGFEIDNDGAEILLEVYNFSDKAMSGIISAKTEGNFTVTETEVNVSVPAGGKETISYILYQSAKNDSNCGYLTFSGNFENQSITQSVSKIYTAVEDVVINDTVSFSNWATIDAWDLTHITRGGSATAEKTENGIKFNLTFSGGDQWFYPIYTLSDEDKNNIKNMSGIAFDFTSETATGTINAMLSGTLMSPIEIKAGTNRILIPFSSFPNNVVESSLDSMRIGVNSPDKNYTYTIENLCLYNDGSTQPENRVIISGISDNEFYTADILTASFSAPDDAISTTVLLNGKEILPSGTSIIMQQLKSGYYELYVGAKMPGGEILSDRMAFYVKNVERETEKLYTREGEKFDLGNATVISGDDYHGGAIAKGANNGILSYNVCLPTDGEYRLTFYLGQELEGTPFVLQVNGLNKDIQSYNYKKNIVYSDVELKAGENTIVCNNCATGELLLDYIEVERFLYEEKPHIVIEGENFLEGADAIKMTESWNANQLDFSELSNNNALKIEGAKGESPYVTYKMFVPKSGNYRLKFTSTPLDNNSLYCRPTITVGKTNYDITSSNSQRSDDKTLECDAVMYNYNYNDDVYLYEGINIVTIKPTEPRDNWLFGKKDYYFLLDDIEFVYSQNTVNEVTTNRNYLKAGEYGQLFVRTYEENPEIILESADINVASVDDFGRIYGHRAGKTFIDVTVGTDRFEIPITVYDSNICVAPIELNGGGFKIGSFGDATFDALVASYYQDEQTTERLEECNIEENVKLLNGEIYQISMTDPISNIVGKGFLWSSTEKMKPIFPVTESKAYVNLEGENFVAGSSVMKLTQSWNAGELDFSRLSENNGLKLEGGSNVNPSASYQINVPVTGNYRMEFTSSPLDNTLVFCNMNIKIGDNLYALTAENATRINNVEFSCDAVFYNYVYKQNIYLTEGVNEISLTPIKGRDWDGGYYFLLDNIEFFKE